MWVRRPPGWVKAPTVKNRQTFTIIKKFFACSFRIFSWLFIFVPVSVRWLKGSQYLNSYFKQLPNRSESFKSLPTGAEKYIRTRALPPYYNLHLSCKKRYEKEHWWWTNKNMNVTMVESDTPKRIHISTREYDDCMSNESPSSNMRYFARRLLLVVCCPFYLHEV